MKESSIRRMNSVWGDSTWRDVAYAVPEIVKPDVIQMNMFAEAVVEAPIPVEEKIAGNAVIVQAFRDRLKKVAGFKYVPEPIAMRNSSGGEVYYIYFASPNETGARIVGDIFSKYRGRKA